MRSFRIYKKMRRPNTAKPIVNTDIRAPRRARTRQVNPVIHSFTRIVSVNDSTIFLTGCAGNAKSQIVCPTKIQLQSINDLLWIWTCTPPAKTMAHSSEGSMGDVPAQSHGAREVNNSVPSDEDVAWRCNVNQCRPQPLCACTLPADGARQ